MKNLNQISTIKDLIDKLSQHPENLRVMVNGYEGGFSDISGLQKITVKLNVHSESCLHMSRFAVRPDLQGNGLGLFLLNLAGKIAKCEGFMCMQLDTAQPAEDVLQFYQDYGFKIIRTNYYEGNPYYSWILEKTI